MIRIIQSADTGKTKQLLAKAAEQGGIVVCRNLASTTNKSIAYGISVPIIDYTEYLHHAHKYSDQKVFIDELETFLSIAFPSVSGYNMTV